MSTWSLVAHIFDMYKLLIVTTTTELKNTSKESMYKTTNQKIALYPMYSYSVKNNK